MWATVEQVIAQTGIEVTDETLAVASAMIDTITGADEEMPTAAITDLDRKHLRKATGWQAVWIAGKLTTILTEREDAESVTSDGQSVRRRDRVEGYLAPLARRELMNLSWIGTRTVMVPRVSEEIRSRNFLNELSDPEWFGGEGAIP